MNRKAIHDEVEGPRAVPQCRRPEKEFSPLTTYAANPCDHCHSEERSAKESAALVARILLSAQHAKRAIANSPALQRRER